MSITLTINGESYPYPSGAEDTNWAAQQVAAMQALAAAINALAAQPYAEATYTDTSGTPGNATANTVRGKSAFASGALSVIITNSLVTTASQVVVTLESFDNSLTSLQRCEVSDGSFTIYANDVAEANPKISWTVLNS